MRFGAVPIDEAEGGIIAHTVKEGALVLRKGAVVTAERIAELRAAGVARVVVAMLDPGDIGEDVAAARLAAAVSGPGVRPDRAITGRSNLFAETAGLLLIGRDRIDAANRLDEAITIATLPAYRPVAEGEMIGTVKIIPFAVAGALIDQAAQRAAGAVAVAPFRGKRVGVISTLLPGLKASIVDKTVDVLRARLAKADQGRSRLICDVRVHHGIDDLAEALGKVRALGAELIIVFGASAITDRRDVIPAALVSAGGVVEHLGMPVDPGNLLMLGALDGVSVIGAPGCARSPKENGFDWVLERLLADQPVTRADIQGMGVGGLLMEIISRPRPRAPETVAAPDIATIVLAAGSARRMGSNKLAEVWNGKAIIRHVVETATAGGGDVIVVTGHDQSAVGAAVAGLPIRTVHNPDHATGMASSLKAGIAALPEGTRGALIMLGDMPRVTPDILTRLRAAMADRPDALAIVPTVAGQRGNPILIGRALFPAVMTLSGDTGARRLIDGAGDRIVEVPIDDPAIMADIDTPEALAALRAQV